MYNLEINATLGTRNRTETKETKQRHKAIQNKQQHQHKIPNQSTEN